MPPLCAMATEWPYEPAQDVVPFDCVTFSDSGDKPDCERVVLMMFNIACMQSL